MSLKMKNRIKKMNFQKQQRNLIEELSDDDKYIIELAGYRKDMPRENYEDIYRIARRAQRSQHI